jgi:glutaredoxin
MKTAGEMPLIRNLLLFLMAVMACSSIHADMYKWTDENGKVHYSDSPPPAGKKVKKLDLKVNSISGPPVVSAFTGNGKPAAATAAASVKIYTTTWCGYCKKAKAYMQARGTRFQEIDVEATAQGQSEFQSLGGRGVPVILVGAQRMDGYSQDSLESLLKQAGL